MKTRKSALLVSIMIGLVFLSGCAVPAILKTLVGKLAGTAAQTTQPAAGASPAAGATQTLTAPAAATTPAAATGGAAVIGNTRATQ